jgi:hypothetical protein
MPAGMARALGQSSSHRAADGRGPEPGDWILSEPIGRTRRGGRLVGGLDLPIAHDARLGRRAERLRQRRQRRRTSGAGVAGWGRVVGFVSHAIAVSFDDERLSMMHQPIDQGGGQGVVHIKKRAPFPEGAIRGQDDRSGFVTGSDHLEQQVSATLVNRQIAQFIKLC